MVKVTRRLARFTQSSGVLVLLELFDRVLLGELRRHLPGVCKNVPFVELKECVELLDPVRHVHRAFSCRLILGEVQIHRDDPIESRDLFLL